MNTKRNIAIIWLVAALLAAAIKCHADGFVNGTGTGQTAAEVYGQIQSYVATNNVVVTNNQPSVTFSNVVFATTGADSPWYVWEDALNALHFSGFNNATINFENGASLIVDGSIIANDGFTGNGAGLTNLQYSAPGVYMTNSVDAAFIVYANGISNAVTFTNGSFLSGYYVHPGANTNLWIDKQKGDIQFLPAAGPVIIYGLSNLLSYPMERHVTLVISNATGGAIWVSNAPGLTIPSRAFNTTNYCTLPAAEVMYEYIEYIAGITNYMN